MKSLAVTYTPGWVEELEARYVRVRCVDNPAAYIED
jgi:hypothetical protein